MIELLSRPDRFRVKPGMTRFFASLRMTKGLVSFKQISGINFLRHIVQGRVVAVGDDGGGAGLEGGEVVHDLGAEEGGAVRERGLIDDHGGALGLDALHDALDGGLAEVVGVGLHREAEDADHAGVLARGVELPGGVVVVVAGLAEDLVRDEVLAGAVRLHDGLDQLLRHVVEVCEELLGVLREAVAAVAEGGVVVVGADAGVQAHALDDRARVEALHFGVGVQLVEVRYPQGQVGVREELHGFGLGGAHQQYFRVVQGGFFQQLRKLFCFCVETPDQVGGDARARALWSRGVQGFAGPFFLVRRNLDPRRAGLTIADYNPGGIQVVVEGFGFAKELGAEEQPGGGVLLPEGGGVAHGDGALDDHHGGGINLQDQPDDLLHVRGVEEVPHRIVVRRRGDHDEVSIGIGGPGVQGGGEGQRLLRQVLDDVLVLDRADAAVDLVHLLGHDVDGDNGVPLRQQRGD